MISWRTNVTSLAKTLFAGLLIVVSLPTWAQEPPYKVVVITNDLNPVTRLPTLNPQTPQVLIYNLDAVSSLEVNLSMLLPKDENQALAIMQQRIAEIGQARLESDLAQAYKALTLAMSYGLDRYPAIIFDDETVMYGLTDVSLAIEKYNEWIIDGQEGMGHE